MVVASLVALLLNEVLGQGLRLVLHILLQLVGLIAKRRSICVAWSTRALFWLEILVHQVGEESAPIELETIAFAILLLVGHLLLVSTMGSTMTCSCALVAS